MVRITTFKTGDNSSSSILPPKITCSPTTCTCAPKHLTPHCADAKQHNPCWPHSFPQCPSNSLVSFKRFLQAGKSFTHHGVVTLCCFLIPSSPFVPAIHCSEVPPETQQIPRSYIMLTTHLFLSPFPMDLCIYCKLFWGTMAYSMRYNGTWKAAIATSFSCQLRLWKQIVKMSFREWVDFIYFFLIARDKIGHWVL